MSRGCAFLLRNNMLSSENTITKGSGAVLLIYIIFAIIMMICLIGFMKRKDKILIHETITSFIAMSVFLYLEIYLKYEIPTYIIALCLLTIVLNKFGGCLLMLYYKSKTYDRYLHALGAFSFALLAYKTLIAFSGEIIESSVFKATIVFSLGMALAGSFEISEYLSDRFRKTREQHGLKDTDFDLIANFVGSVIAAIFAVILVS